MKKYHIYLNFEIGAIVQVAIAPSLLISVFQ